MLLPDSWQTVVERKRKMKILGVIVLIALLAADVVLMIQNHSLKQQVVEKLQLATNAATPIDPTYFGIYTYAGFGAWLAPEGSNGKRTKAPLTLNVFLSSRTESPALTSEMAVLRRLESVMSKRGQRIIAVCDVDDSTGVAEILDMEKLQVPLMPFGFEDSNTTFADLGISPFSMPFKVIYDSTFCAIYVRGADNTPESQADFERAAMRLSDLVYRGEL